MSNTKVELAVPVWVMSFGKTSEALLMMFWCSAESETSSSSVLNAVLNQLTSSLPSGATNEPSTFNV